jgi:hypothetical protein
MTRLSAHHVADAILRDRQRQRPARSVSRERPEGADFDPFAITRWRVIAGTNPGYLVKTPMRRGPVGWFIACGYCGAEFEPKGWRCCPSCMRLPAEQRRAKPAPSGRQCQVCDGMIPKRSRADAKFCSPECKKRLANARSYQGSAHPQFSTPRGEILQQKQGPKSVLIGPTDWPIGAVGGRRFPGDRRLDPARRRSILDAELPAKRRRP